MGDHWPLEEDVLEDDYYIVEHILDLRRRQDGKLEFLVKWRGYSKKHNTWEPLEHLNAGARKDAMALVDSGDGEDAAGEPDGGEGVNNATSDDNCEAQSDAQPEELASTGVGEQQASKEDQQRVDGA
ncbi:MAG: hypothetical protein SGPRY_003289 [Prymnesium sp.]